MVAKCPRCGTNNGPGAKFCNQCGASLGASAAAQKVEPHDDLQGERRHLTVLFSDLVNSTAITYRLDPEEQRAIAADYQRAAAKAVESFGGHVAKFLGDGVMAYFGWPQAHDNDAERAVRAGLAILDAIAALNGRGNRPKLSARVGIHTGSVVVGAGGGTDTDIFGDAPNLASRVQTAAEPDTVVITADTHRLTAGMFVVEDRGAHQLKGIAAAVELCRVVGPSGVRDRLHASGRAPTPFVGREDDLRLLANRWELAREGEGQVVLIAGEPGIGKSRLIEQFHERLAGTPHTWIEGASEPYYQNTPFHPVADLINQAFGLRAEHTKEERLDRLERELGRAGNRATEQVLLIAQFLNLPVGNRYPAVTLSPEQMRKRLLAALANSLFGAATMQPTVLVLEDLHWVDASSLELLQVLVEQGATAPLMLVCTARPEFRAPWPMRAHHAQVTLSHLHNRQVREMIAGVASGSALGSEVIDAVVSRTSGVPLFVEELTRAVLESVGRDASREIPETLEDSLTARLDRLGPAKEVAQVASVIGREFSYELLRAVSPMPEDELQSALTKLADAELIYVRGIAPEATYQFKHALIREAAYEALLKSRRKELHRRVAMTIGEKFPAMADERPELLARHWSEAGQVELAIDHWRRAGRAMHARHAFKEAEESYRQALAMLNNLPESPERDARELDLVGTLVTVLFATRPWTGPELIEATARARALAEKSGDLAKLVRELHGMWVVAVMSDTSANPTALADQILELARRDGTRGSLGLAQNAQFITHYWRGDLVGAEEHFKRGLAYWEASPDGGLLFGSAASILVGALGYASWTAWTLGFCDTARERSRHQLAVARESGNPVALGLALFECGLLHCQLRAPEQAEILAAEGVTLSEQGIPALGGGARIALGWARARLGRPDEGVALIRQGMDPNVRRRTSYPLFYTLLAEAEALNGATTDALDSIEKALAANPKELVNRPEAIRVRGELRLGQGRVDLAEADFRNAIALAQTIRAKSWELRATISLARLLRDTNRRDEVRTMLASIYGWFSDGFETADLKDAKALLDELSK